MKNRLQKRLEKLPAEPLGYTARQVKNYDLLKQKDNPHRYHKPYQLDFGIIYKKLEEQNNGKKNRSKQSVNQHD